MTKGKPTSTSEAGQISAPDRTPPVPGAIWCNSCSSWCLPSGICRCNNR
ncbi:hypothetical protein [Streptomyces sp. DSM 40907]|nr:hypothetical protein [Streptomyces sp. DSM 40907]